MSKNKKIVQMAALGLSFAICAGVYWAPKNHTREKIKQQKTEEATRNIQQQIDEVKAELKSDALSEINAFELQYRNTSNTPQIQLAYLDSVIFFWDKQMRPAIAAIYAEEKADRTGSIADRLTSGNRYLEIADFLKPEDKLWAYEEGKAAFQKVLDKEPNNTEAKISLGVCMVQSGQDSPMEGIGLIREVLDVEPTNIRAILQLGHFSVLSGQYSKALERYQEAYQIDSTLHEALFFIGDTYAKMGDMQKAREYLNQYAALQTDPFVKEQIELYIEELTIKSNPLN